MNKRLGRITSIIIALALTFGFFTSGQAKSKDAALMSAGIVNLAFFYKPPTNSDAATVANNFSSIVLTGGDEAFRDQLKANGGDFCSISDSHPDWFLLDTNGQRILASPGSDTYRMDPGNPGWRNFFVTRVLEWQEKNGWSGLFLDNLEASLSDIQRNGYTLAKYPDDASYQAAVIAFLQYLNVNYSRPYNRPVIANIIARRDEASWFSYIQYLDGAMQERWAVDWSLSIYVSETKWKSDMVLAEKTQSQGKYIILRAPGNTTDADRQKFAFASYLLISNGKAAFRYSDGNYREVWLYNNYQVDIGTPLGPRYQSGSLWRRDFTKGSVTVDPVNHTSTISTSASPVSPSTSTPTASPATSPTPLMPTATPTTGTPTTTPIQPTSTSLQPTATPIILPTETVALPTATFLPTATTIVQPTTTSSPTRNPSSETIYDDKNAAFVYSPGWQNKSSAKAYLGSYELTTQDSESVTFTFTGQSFSIIYKGGPNFSKLDVYVDGQQVGTFDQKSDSPTYQKRWDYPGQLVLGKHK